MKALRYLILSAAALTLSSVVAIADTWICDSKSSVGYDIQRGYELVRFSAGRSYRVKVDIEKEDLSLDYQRSDLVFKESEVVGEPASIQPVGGDFVALCTYWEQFERIVCDGPMPFGGNFTFSLSSGRFSMVQNDYPVNGGQSWIEVGECRRIN
jgi:hypothetical protein